MAMNIKPVYVKYFTPGVFQRAALVTSMTTQSCQLTNIKLVIIGY